MGALEVIEANPDGHALVQGGEAFSGGSPIEVLLVDSMGSLDLAVELFGPGRDGSVPDGIPFTPDFHGMATLLGSPLFIEVLERELPPIVRLDAVDWKREALLEAIKDQRPERNRDQRKRNAQAHHELGQVGIQLVFRRNHPGLRPLSERELEDMALVLYGPEASADLNEQYYVPSGEQIDWIVNTAGNPRGVAYANNVRAKVR